MTKVYIAMHKAFVQFAKSCEEFPLTLTYAPHSQVEQKPIPH